ncbi:MULTISPECIES: phage N-6-adenine-methyltransferase [Enterobacteriaceae]|uniref:Phage N-6-adenine-methyltransferase n=1 Tax=Enterobacter hormaechei subsp. hoffmannii TaxID=1812934 RepID=A0A9Q2WAP5_9ENTR|nr:MULTISPECIES: phage N-6-adenine-methyltransferase [Enterobacteriaceae]EAA1242955.1 phage N-6-adenine-methyltransferase [Salmonella enterica subsp. enterica serovar Mbandaka]EBS2684417.1 phage N-6-adenine-methyltransferase [Salmonella enterica subsp. enterica serovar Montevideo]EDM4432494.1 phage N-6-adenine-methyltransferase [Salmonella enterica subsp. enterica serovar Infantis]MBT1778292.1 phage N-6-adenine-methyltransferase [Enterobacter hormaechei subsp. hoffmannii]HDW3274283.1 phage N-6
MIAAEKIKKRERDTSLRDLWRTPQWLFVAIQRYIGVKFDVDVACNKENALLPNFIGVERDALTCEWGNPGTVAFLNPPYSKITPWIDAAIREQARGVTTVMLIPQSLDTKWYERAAECANETVILSGGRVAFIEPDVELGLVEVNINPGGSMLVIFRGHCQDAGHTISKVPLTVMKKLGGYDPSTVIRKKRPPKKAA